MRELIKNRVYRHFKGKHYYVIDEAIDTETREAVVIYRALYGDYGLFVRPKSMFLSEVDHVKYPDVEQKYRFELVDDD